jgi:hypothetical protein
MDPNAITTQFTDHYYQLFGSGQRANMRSLYHADSSLSFEGTQFNGPDAIIGKLTTLAFQQVAVQCISRDWLPGPNNCLVIMVNGSMQLPGEANKLKFSQCFTLVAQAGNNFYLKNDLFRCVVSPPPTHTAHAHGAFPLGVVQIPPR